MKEPLVSLNISRLKKASMKKTTSGRRARHKLEVLKRDGFKCVHCDTPDNLTIAHITPPKRNKNRNASSYKVDDCQTLCIKCHILYDA